MNKVYLTISEFAKLRNVSIGSLRYYEQLKILTPARVDPNTNYRYYLPTQLATLDTILLCIDLDIPLKELKNYMDADGDLDLKKILTTGKETMQKKISEMQTKLEITKYHLDRMERNHDHSNQTGFYTREIEERFFLEVALDGDLKDLFQQDQVPMKLFHEAQKENLLPVFSAGFILHYEKEPAAFSLYLQVLHPAENDKRILHLPKSSYLCLQTDMPIQTSTKQMLEKRIKNTEKKMVILTKMIEQKLHYENMRCEIQIPLE